MMQSRITGTQQGHLPRAVAIVQIKAATAKRRNTVNMVYCFSGVPNPAASPTGAEAITLRAMLAERPEGVEQATVQVPIAPVATIAGVTPSWRSPMLAILASLEVIVTASASGTAFPLSSTSEKVTPTCSSSARVKAESAMIGLLLLLWLPDMGNQRVCCGVARVKP
jgi:hypothetical protein